MTLAANILSNGIIQSFFITHLNRVYCIKSLLSERLPEIEFQVHDAGLKTLVTGIMSDASNQVDRMDEIYGLMGVTYSFDNCDGLISMAEEAFTASPREPGDPASRDLAILFYLQNIESVNIASFEVLKIGARILKNNRIKLLLSENFKETKVGRSLILRLLTNSMSTR